jgi:hypothetical protein
VADDPFPVNNLLGAAKSREVQRAMLAEMRGDRPQATLHSLAAAHMELVLAVDFERAGEAGLALRSRVSAASCLWRAGQAEPARKLLESLALAHPSEAADIQKVIAELNTDFTMRAG